MILFYQIAIGLSVLTCLGFLASYVHSVFTDDYCGMKKGWKALRFIFPLMVICFLVGHLAITVYRTSYQANLISVETSLQLQAIADGCLNKGGE